MLAIALIVLGLVMLVIIIAFAMRALSGRKSTQYFTDVSAKDLNLRGGSRFSYSEDKGRILPRSGHRTNGKMPSLLLSPMRTYVPATLGTVALVTFLLAFLW